MRHVLRTVALLATLCATDALAITPEDVLRTSPSVGADPAVQSGRRALDDAVLLDSIDKALKDANLSGEAEAALRDERGGLLLSTNDLDGAIAEFSAVIRLRPNDEAAFGQRAAAHLFKGDIEAARADAAEAVRLNANSVGGISRAAASCSPQMLSTKRWPSSTRSCALRRARLSRSGA